MRVTIEHREKTTGLIRKTTLHEVHTRVEFSAQEQGIIRQRKLSKTIVMDRGPDAQAQKNVTPDRVASFGDFFDLKISDLEKGADVYRLSSPLEAKVYDEKLKAHLRTLKEYLEGNAETRTGAESFEL
jgi:hypothetical protein